MREAYARGPAFFLALAEHRQVHPAAAVSMYQQYVEAVEEWARRQLQAASAQARQSLTDYTAQLQARGESDEAVHAALEKAAAEMRASLDTQAGQARAQLAALKQYAERIRAGFWSHSAHMHRHIEGHDAMAHGQPQPHAQPQPQPHAHMQPQPQPQHAYPGHPSAAYAQAVEYGAARGAYPSHEPHVAAARGPPPGIAPRAAAPLVPTRFLRGDAARRAPRQASVAEMLGLQQQQQQQ